MNPDFIVGLLFVLVALIALIAGRRYISPGKGSTHDRITQDQQLRAKDKKGR